MPRKSIQPRKQQGHRCTQNLTIRQQGNPYVLLTPLNFDTVTAALQPEFQPTVNLQRMDIDDFVTVSAVDQTDETQNMETSPPSFGTLEEVVDDDVDNMIPCFVVLSPLVVPGYRVPQQLLTQALGPDLEIYPSLNDPYNADTQLLDDDIEFSQSFIDRYHALLNSQAPLNVEHPSQPIVPLSTPEPNFSQGSNILAPIDLDFNPNFDRDINSELAAGPSTRITKYGWPTTRPYSSNFQTFDNSQVQVRRSQRTVEQEQNPSQAYSSQNTYMSADVTMASDSDSDSNHSGITQALAARQLEMTIPIPANNDLPVGSAHRVTKYGWPTTRAIPSHVPNSENSPIPSVAPIPVRRSERIARTFQQ